MHELTITSDALGHAIRAPGDYGEDWIMLLGAVVA